MGDTEAPGKTEEKYTIPNSGQVSELIDCLNYIIKHSNGEQVDVNFKELTLDDKLKNAMNFIYLKKPGTHKGATDFIEDLITVVMDKIGEVVNEAGEVNEAEYEKKKKLIEVACNIILLYKVLIADDIPLLAKAVSLNPEILERHDFYSTLASEPDKIKTELDNELNKIVSAASAMEVVEPDEGNEQSGSQSESGQPGSGGGRRMKKKTKKMNRKFLRNKSKKLKKPKKTKKGKKGKKGKKKRKTHKK